MNNLDPLPCRIKRHGFFYIKLMENEKAFIYEQWGYGKMIAFEVFKKVIKTESINWGKVLPAKIRFPNNEAFGKWVMLGFLLSLLGAMALTVSTEFVLTYFDIPASLHEIARWKWP